MKTIINNEKSFGKTLKFLKKYFKNVKVINNQFSHLANRSQNYYKTILFNNRETTFSIKWNYGYSTLFLGDITNTKNTLFQYTFTKIRFDNCYPIEEGNNSNIMFWEKEMTDSHDDISSEISPFRMPITKSSK